MQTKCCSFTKEWGKEKLNSVRTSQDSCSIINLTAFCVIVWRILSPRLQDKRAAAGGNCHHSWARASCLHWGYKKCSLTQMGFTRQSTRKQQCHSRRELVERYILFVNQTWGNTGENWSAFTVVILLWTNVEL